MSTKARPSFSFYVPCLNEVQTVSAVLDTLHTVCAARQIDHDVVVVDDGSTDGSLDLIRTYCAEHPNQKIVLVENRQRMGIGFNYRVAARLGSGDYIMLVGADGSEDDTLIHRMIDALQDGLNINPNLDAVVPYFVDNRSRSRRWLSVTFAALVRTLSGVKLTYFNGPSIHRRTTVLQIGSTSSGFSFQAEMLVLGHFLGAEYSECEVANKDRQYGKSKAFGLKSWLSVAHSLVQILSVRVRFLVFPINASLAPLRPTVRVYGP